MNVSDLSALLSTLLCPTISQQYTRQDSTPVPTSLPIIAIDAFLPPSLLLPLFLRATAGTAIARLSHRNSVRLSVRPSVRPSVTRVDQAKTVQARIIKSSPSLPQRL